MKIGKRLIGINLVEEINLSQHGESRFESILRDVFTFSIQLYLNKIASKFKKIRENKKKNKVNENK